MKPMGGGMLDNATLAFKYLRQFPDILPLVGIQAVQEIEEIVAVMEGPAGMSDAERAAAEQIRCELGARYCRSCDYCQPCQEGIGISTVLRFRSSVKRFPVGALLWRMGTGADRQGRELRRVRRVRGALPLSSADQGHAERERHLVPPGAGATG